MPANNNAYSLYTKKLLKSNFKGLMKPILYLCLAGALSYGCTRPSDPKKDFDFEKEKMAIQAVIAKETTSYYKQDFESWKSTYLQSPAFRKVGYWEGYPEKVVTSMGFESLATEKKKQFDANETLWKGSTEERKNESFRITPEMAWYTFEQFSYENNTQKLLGRSFETRILEKENGQWKIAYLRFCYCPEPVVQ